MAQTALSVLRVDEDPVSSSPVTPAAFVPGSANLFPKMPHQIDEHGWELWQFDACDSSRHQAVTVSFYRDSRTVDKGGFRVDVNAIWEDGSKWGQSVVFPETEVTGTPRQGGKGPELMGVWRSKAESISFQVDEACSTATVQLSVPGRVTGFIELQTLTTDTNSCLPATEEAASLGPSVYYIFPMGPARCTAMLEFHSNATEGVVDGDKTLGIGGGGGSGGMVRGWSPLSFLQIFNDAYYLNAAVGPYHLQMIRILSPSVDGESKTHAIARLHLHGKLVCAAAAREAEAGVGGTVVVEKVLVDGDRSTDDSGELIVRGEFSDKNVGYVVSLTRQEHGEQWRFEARHRLIWWSDPTSPNGKQGPGKSGFLETITGDGNKESQLRGIGLAGQLQLPKVPPS